MQMVFVLLKLVLIRTPTTFINGDTMTNEYKRQETNVHAVRIAMALCMFVSKTFLVK